MATMADRVKNANTTNATAPKPRAPYTIDTSTKPLTSGGFKLSNEYALSFDKLPSSQSGFPVDVNGRLLGLGVPYSQEEGIKALGQLKEYAASTKGGQYDVGDEWRAKVDKEIAFQTDRMSAAQKQNDSNAAEMQRQKIEDSRPRGRQTTVLTDPYLRRRANAAYTPIYQGATGLLEGTTNVSRKTLLGV
jgi:hypothetical protein